ncbi:MAG: hypothetical protein ISP24_02805 [Rickettsiales bacterium]|nr:hypothetical protein [Rickettsiales bacterium]
MINAPNTGDTALMMAISADQLSSAKFLLDIGADINIKNKLGKTAYNIAFERAESYKGIATLMLEKIEKSPGYVDPSRLGAKDKDLIQAISRGLLLSAKHLLRDDTVINVENPELKKACEKVCEKIESYRKLVKSIEEKSCPDSVEKVCEKIESYRKLVKSIEEKSCPDSVRTSYLEPKNTYSDSVGLRNMIKEKLDSTGDKVSRKGAGVGVMIWV